MCFSYPSLFSLDPEPFVKGQKDKLSFLIHNRMVGPGLESPGLPVPSDKRDTRSLKQVFAQLCVAQMKKNVWILFNGIFFTSLSLVFGLFFFLILLF